jgi:hypothetical protein
MGLVRCPKTGIISPLSFFILLEAVALALSESFPDFRQNFGGKSRWRRSPDLNASQWPVKRAAEIPGDIVIGGLHMIHEREDAIICGPVMPQGGLQVVLRRSDYRHFAFY